MYENSVCVLSHPLQSSISAITARYLLHHSVLSLPSQRDISSITAWYHFHCNDLLRDLSLHRIAMCCDDLRWCTEVCDGGVVCCIVMCCDGLWCCAEVCDGGVVYCIVMCCDGLWCCTELCDGGVVYCVGRVRCPQFSLTSECTGAAVSTSTKLPESCVIHFQFRLFYMFLSIQTLQITLLKLH